MIIKYEEELSKKLVTHATNVASNAFKRHMSESEVKDHLIGDSLYLLINDNQLNGFAVFNHLEDILYLKGIAVKQDNQKTGFFNHVIKGELKSLNYKFISLRTQSAVMYNAVLNLTIKGLLKEVHPSSIKPNKQVINALKKVKSHLNMKGDSFITKRFYGECLYGEEYYYKGKPINTYQLTLKKAMQL